MAALAREPARVAPRPLLLNRSRPLVESIAEALGGVAAGDPRRWRDASERLAVVCSSARAASLLDRFEGLPQIVTVVERETRRALGVTVEGVPVELVVAPPARFGTELVRATGSPEWVAAHEPLPDAARRGRRLPRARGSRSCLRSYAKGVLGRPRPRCSSSPRCGATSTATRRGPTGAHRRTRWASPRASSATTTSRSATTRSRSAPYGPDRGRRPAPGRGDRRGERAARAVPAPARDRVRHPARRLARPPRGRARGARLGAGERPRRPARLARGADAASADGAGLAVRSCLSHPTGRLINHRPPNAVDLEAVFARLAERAARSR